MSRANSVQNELLVKFKTGTVSQLRSSGANKVTSGLSSVDAILSHYDLEEAVQLLPGDKPGRTLRSAPAFSGKTVRETSLNQLYKLKVAATSAKNSFQMMDELKALPEVEYAEPNYIVSALGMNKVAAPLQKTTQQAAAYSPNDPLYPQQYGIPAVQLPALYDRPVIRNKRPIIAILDTGVDTEHPDLADNIWTNLNEESGNDRYDDDENGFIDDLHGWDFVNKTPDVRDFNAHGTHCAGIAAAVGNNGIGISGANPNALIMPLAVLQSNGQGDVATIIQAVNYAANNGADIISMSFGTYSYSIALEQALGQAYQTAILVAAAGNDGRAIDPNCCPFCIPPPAPMFPAAFTFVLGIEASDVGGNLCGWSNYDCDGPVFSQFTEEQLYNYELRAPGAGIISTIPGGQYRSLNGTSMAAPLVAGGIATLLERKEFVSQEELWASLIQSAAGGPVNFDAVYSFIPPPQLNMVSVEINDTVSGDSDMRADAGELLEIYPTLKNTGSFTGGENDTIYYTLTFAEFEDNSTATILDNDTKLGNPLSAYAKMKAANPVRVQISPNVVDGRVIRLVLTAWHGNHLDEKSQEFQVYVENGVELRGMLTQDMTLYPDVHYIVTDNLAIPEGVTLTIKPGTVLKFKDEASLASAGQIKAIGTPDSMIVFTKTDLGNFWRGISFSAKDTLSYFVIEYYSNTTLMCTNFSNAIMQNNFATIMFGQNTQYSNFYYNFFSPYFAFYNNNNDESNNNISLVKNIYSDVAAAVVYGGMGCISNSNVFSNQHHNGNHNFSIAFISSYPYVFTPAQPSYHGSAVESIARKGIFDFYTPHSGTFGVYDLSNMLTRPSAESHGIVWKVEVNGYDAQDAFDLLPPLGVGTHKFEVYFNRAMDTLVTPMVAMGVRPPYTQNAISENGSWSPDSTIYTAFYTVKAAGATDGLNRIYVAGARDNEHFEIPYENDRFNVIVQAAGSLSNGFEATPGLGKVDLEWETPDGYFDDLLGYNIYRYTWLDDGITSDTTMINTSLLSETVFTDFDVVPGKTYCYAYKVMRTDLTENDYSKVVSAVPYTAQKGDANGSLSIDVADIVSTVAHITGNHPAPFIFEAADVNSDGTVNVLDIVAIVNLILGPQAASTASVASTATYSIENGKLFVESPVALGGVQFVLLADRNSTPVQSLEALQGFEIASQWLNDSTYMLLAFSMTGNTIEAGRNALLQLGEAIELQGIVLSDAQGRNITVTNAPTGMEPILQEGNEALRVFPNPFAENLHIVFNSPLNTGAKVDLLITDLTGRTIDRITGIIATGGRYEYTYAPGTKLDSGIYFCTLRINNVTVKTERIIYAK
jgi:subtilisin family serine protease